MKWLEDEDDVYDSLPAKDIVDDKPVYAIEVGRRCQARYLGELYPVQVIAKGDYIHLVHCVQAHDHLH